MAGYAADDERELTGALRELHDGSGDDAAELTSRLAASQIIAVQRTLARENWRRLSEGLAATQLYPAAVTAAEHAFGLLRSGLAVRYG